MAIRKQRVSDRGAGSVPMAGPLNKKFARIAQLFRVQRKNLLPPLPVRSINYAITVGTYDNNFQRSHVQGEIVAKCPIHLSNKVGMYGVAHQKTTVSGSNLILTS
jgi:hypothetical protein